MTKAVFLTMQCLNLIAQSVLALQKILKNVKDADHYFVQHALMAGLKSKSYYLQCPMKCNPNRHSINALSVSLKRMYNNIDIKCTHCKKTKKLGDIVEHEMKCNKPKCLMHEYCGNQINPAFKKEKVCDHTCILLMQWKKYQANPNEMLKQIAVHRKKYENYVGQVGGGSHPNKNSDNNWVWDNNKKGTGIKIDQNGKRCFLKEQAYMFRTIIANKVCGFTSGVHYWELHADKRTENELKIGVTNKPGQNFNSAFCDYDYGWAYYGLGQLRHGSNASGSQYGKRFRKQGVLGVLLDMNKGQLSFSLNGEFMGVAFSDNRLKRGPLFPAVSLLHCAGISADTSKQPPKYMLR